MALIHAIYEPFKNQMLHPSSPEPLPSCNPHLLSPSLPASLIFASLLSCILPVLHPIYLCCISSVLHPTSPVQHPSCTPSLYHPSCPEPSFLYPSSPESILSFIPPYLHSSFPAPAFQDTNLEKYGTCEVCQQKK